MAIDNVTTSTSTALDGNAITTAVSNDKLTNEDFLKLMLEEMKLQDPTKPMDSQRMLDSQMQMSSIETNLSTIEAMKSLQSSFSQMAISTAANLVGRIVENGEYSETGDMKGFLVSSVELVDGELILSGYQNIGYDDEAGELIYAEEKSIIPYTSITKIY